MANLRLLFVKELTLCKKLQGKDWRALLAEQWIERMETVWSPNPLTRISQEEFMDHLQKSWSDPKGSSVQGFKDSSEILKGST